MKKDYLLEDRDLIDELESIGPMSTGLALEEQKRKISEIQIKSILRNRKTSVEFNQATDKYTIILIAFAVIQIILTLLQLAVAASDLDNKTVGLFYIIFSGLMIWVVLKDFIKTKNIKGD